MSDKITIAWADPPILSDKPQTWEEVAATYRDAWKKAEAHNEQQEVLVGALRATIAALRVLHDSPIHQSFNGGCEGCLVLRALDGHECPETA